MRIIHNELHISVPVDIAFSWFKDLDKNYLRWHPPTHREFVWLSEKPVGRGTRFYFSEDIKGHNHTLFMVITAYAENERLSFASESIHVKSRVLPDCVMIFLSSLLRIRIEMDRTFNAVSEHETIIRTHHRFGCHLPVLNRWIERFLNAFIFSSSDHENHMKEEGEYMRWNLEAKQAI